MTKIIYKVAHIGSQLLAAETLCSRASSKGHPVGIIPNTTRNFLSEGNALKFVTHAINSNTVVCFAGLNDSFSTRALSALRYAVLPYTYPFLSPPNFPSIP